MDELRLKTERSRINAMGTNALQDSAAEAAPIEASIYTPQQSVTNVPVNPALQQAQTGFQVIPQGQPIPLVAPTLAQPAPAPTQPLVNALTSNAQLDALSRNPPNTPGRLNSTTGQPELDPLTAKRLALTAQQGGPAGDKAHQQLQDYGIAASTNAILGKSPEMIHAMNQKAAMDEQSLPPAERKLAEKDRARAMAIHTQQREQAYADDVRKMKYDTEQEKLGLEKDRRTEVQGMIGLHAEEMIDKQLDRQRKAAMAPYELSKAKTEAERNAIQLKNEQDVQALINPDTAKANELMAAPTIDKYEQTWEQAQGMAARYNIPEPVKNQLHLGVLASSYDSPVELAKDVKGMTGFPEGITGVSGSDVAKHIPEINDAIANNLPPDQAVEQILKDSGKDPTDKGYPQLALNISTGVWKHYKDAGTAAMKEAQATKVQSDIQNSQKASDQITQKIPQLATAEGWNDIVASTQKRLDRLDLVRGMKSAVGSEQGVLAEAGVRSTLGLGAPAQYSKMTESEIKDMLITHLFGSAENDKPLQAWLADQKTNPDPAFQRLLTMGVQEARKGIKEADFKEAEEKDKFDKAAKENAAEGLYTAKSPEGKPVSFSTKAEWNDYIHSGTFTQEGIKQATEAMTKIEAMMPPGNEAWKALPKKTQAEFVDRYYKIKWALATNNRQALLALETNPKNAKAEIEGMDKTYGLNNEKSAPATQAAAGGQVKTVTMTFPDGKKKLVPASDQQRYTAMGGKTEGDTSFGGGVFATPQDDKLAEQMSVMVSQYVAKYKAIPHSARQMLEGLDLNAGDNISDLHPAFKGYGADHNHREIVFHTLMEQLHKEQ